MNKKYFILTFILLLGILFLGTNNTNTVKIETNKKEVKENTTDKYGSVYFSSTIVKTDESRNPLNDVEFKLHTYNNIYSARSEQVDEGVYYISNNYEGKSIFDKAYNTLSSEQKHFIESLKTEEDLFNLDPDDYYIMCNDYYGNEAFGASGTPTLQDPDDVVPSGGYCRIAMPTVFTLEETRVPTGYVKDKVLVPGGVEVVFYVPGLSIPTLQVGQTPSMTKGSDVLKSSDDHIEVVEIYVFTDNGYMYEPGIYIPFGDIQQNRLVGTKFEEIINLWKEYARKNVNCSMVRVNEGDLIPQAIDNYLQAASATYSGPPMPAYYYGCPISLVNKKGSPNVRITSTVNGQDKITAKSNATLDYRVTVTNVGNVDSIENVIVSKLPEGLQYVEGSASHGGRYSNGQIIWDLDRIDEGSTVVLTYKAVVPKGANPLKNYVSEASISSYTLPNKVNSNQTAVKVEMLNPKTGTQFITFGALFAVFAGLVIYLILAKKGNKNFKKFKFQKESD